MIIKKKRLVSTSLGAYRRQSEIKQTGGKPALTAHGGGGTLGNKLLLPHSDDHRDDAEVTDVSGELLSLRYCTGCLWEGQEGAGGRGLFLNQPQALCEFDRPYRLTPPVRVHGDATTPPPVLTKGGDR